MRKTTALSIVTILTATFSGGIFADNHKQNAGQDMKLERFKEADTNNDGLLSHSEALARVKEKFDGLDTNGDGFLALEELPKKMPVPEHAQRRMERHKAKMKARMDERGQEDGQMSKKMQRRKEGQGKEHGKLTRLKFVAKLDRDGDEKVSFDEFSVRAVKRFKKHDLDGDGNISLAELEKAPKHPKKKKHHRDGKRRDG